MDSDQQEKKIMAIDECAINILAQEPNLQANEVALKACKLLNRDVDRSEINRLFYGQLRDRVVQDKQYRWSIRGAFNTEDTTVKAVQTTQGAFSKLCKYYLDCLSRDDGGISLFRDSKFGDPAYYELRNLPFDSVRRSAIFKDESVTRLISKARSNRSSMSLSLGYPIRLRHLRSSRTHWEGYKVEPLFLFPVDFDENNKGESKIQWDDLRINPEALKGVTEMSGGNVLEDINQLADELGIAGDASGDLPELDELMLRMQKIRPEWQWQEDIKADDINAEPAIENLDRDGFYNRVIIFASERSPYTKGLETELASLGKLSVNDFQNTALGYWLTGERVNEEVDNDEALLEILPLNEEQRTAVQKSLSRPLTVITGPPGTGKSQVVTALLLNAAWKNKTVLFASKNNKAVDVVEIRANGLSTRPVVMRLGANDIQGKLAEYLADLLAVPVTEEDKARYKEIEAIYNQTISRYSKIEANIADLVKLRNDIDKLEQSIEFCRKQFGDGLFERFENLNIDTLDKSLSALENALHLTDYVVQPFLKRMFWKFFKNQHFKIANQQIDKSKACLASFNLSVIDSKLTEENMTKWVEVICEARERYAKIPKIQEYFSRLEKIKNSPGLPDLNKEQLDITNSLSDISSELWEAWVRLMPSRLDSQDRRDLQSYTSIVKLIVKGNLNNEQLGKDVFTKYNSLFPKISKMFPCWAITSLSVRGKAPFLPNFFDLVVIDEASQCDIASALPLLYRAKRAVIIGDPKQLRHISTISQKQDVQLLAKHGVQENYIGWNYSETSLYDLAQGLCAPENLVNLRDHHRSHADIISYSNKQFYGTSLRVATDYSYLKPLRSGPAIIWNQVEGNMFRPASGGALNQEECQEIKNFLSKILQSNYDGSIGVVTPFRAQAIRIRDLVAQDDKLTSYLNDRDFLVDTVHRFQGDERDLMIFSPVISGNIPKGAFSFLSRNGNLFNVAITRTRSTLVVIGDKTACSNSDISYLSAFCQHVDGLQEKAASQTPERDDWGPEYPAVSNLDSVSDWEKILYRGLYGVGIKTTPQYSVESYRLDLAFKLEKYKLDIEVDGERYHRNWDGELCRRDKIRNRRLIELGWDVIRFWVYEIRDDLKGCVNRVQERIKDKNKKTLSTTYSIKSSEAIESLKVAEKDAPEFG